MSRAHVEPAERKSDAVVIAGGHRDVDVMPCETNGADEDNASPHEINFKPAM